MNHTFSLARLSQYQKVSLSRPNYKPAAVLLPFYYKNEEPFILFTLRNQRVTHHKGEISFPGGVFERNDPSLLHTALRETEEELGIPSKQIEVLGELDDVVVPTKYHITPFAAQIQSPFHYQMNPHEIEQVLEIPLKHFLNEKNFEEKEMTYSEKKILMPFFYWKEHCIWGATARVLKQFLNLIHDTTISLKQSA